MDKFKGGKTAVEVPVHLDKTQVLQEAKQCFTATNEKTKKLVDVLTKCIFILLQGERLTSKEATDLFFQITRSFQYKDKDSTLRRLTYIGIKALSKQAENVYVVTSSLTTDVNSSKEDAAVRASALRALCQISDASTFTSIERYLRQSVVDKHPVVASAALSSLIRIASVNSEVVRRCTNEIQEALNSDSPTVQYHALLLSYLSFRNDRFAISRLLTTCINQGLISPLATCHLLRIMANYIIESPADEDIKRYTSYIGDCLSHPSEMVEFEASRIIVSPENTKLMQKLRVSSSVSHLRNFLSSPKPALRFGSVRLLNEISSTSKADVRYWSIHRIGRLCKLHLLNKRYRPGDEIIGILDFQNSNVACVKYTCMLQCEEVEKFILKQEFSLGLKQDNFVITIPHFEKQNLVLHCILSFLFYIADENYPKALFADKAGTIELGPQELETKLFSCDFPLAIYL